MLRAQLISDPRCPETDFTTVPWRDAGLVTPRHGVRMKWNEAAVEEFSASSGVQRYVIRADDTAKDRRGRRELTLQERIDVEQRRLRPGRKDRNELPSTVELAIGMRVLVTTNVETDLDITNGARGVIVGICLQRIPRIG